MYDHLRRRSSQSMSMGQVLLRYYLMLEGILFGSQTNGAGGRGGWWFQRVLSLDPKNQPRAGFSILLIELVNSRHSSYP